MEGGVAAAHLELALQIRVRGQPRGGSLAQLVARRLAALQPLPQLLQLRAQRRTCQGLAGVRRVRATAGAKASTQDCCRAVRTCRTLRASAHTQRASSTGGAASGALIACVSSSVAHARAVCTASWPRGSNSCGRRTQHSAGRGAVLCAAPLSAEPTRLAATRAHRDTAGLHVGQRCIAIRW